MRRNALYLFATVIHTICMHLYTVLSTVLTECKCLTPVSYTHLDVYKRQGPIVFGEDRLTGRGSLPATFYVLKVYFLWQTIRVKQNQIVFCM